MSIPILDKDYFLSIKNLTWEEIAFALESNFIIYSYIVDYAIKRFLEGSSDPNDLIMGACNPNKEFEVKDVLNKIVNHVNKESLYEKWAYIYLYFLRITKERWKDPFVIIEEIYCDFGHPEFLERLIGYMPAPNNEKVDMDKEWDNYLVENKYLAE